MSNPVTIDPNTTYVASYYAPSGHYTATAGYFYPSPAPTPVGGAETNSPPLKAVPNTGAIVDGVYSYSAASTFPSSTYNATNYWVDVLFAPTVVGPPGQVTGVSATAGQNSATVTWSAPSSGGTPTSYTVTPFIGSTAQTPMSVTGSATSATVTGLTAGTAYTFTVQASNSSGSGPVSAPSNSVTPTAATAPGAPTGVSAGPASSQALLSWTAPGSDGGSPITGYTVTPYIGTSAQAPLQVNSGSATSAIVTGLTNGASYTSPASASTRGRAAMGRRAIRADVIIATVTVGRRLETPPATVGDTVAKSCSNRPSPALARPQLPARCDPDKTTSLHERH